MPETVLCVIQLIEAPD